MSASYTKLRLSKAYPQDLKNRSNLSEVFTKKAVDAGSGAFVLSQIGHHSKPILYVQDYHSAQESGQPYFRSMDRQFLFVSLSRATDLLWALEEGLRCTALAAVIGEVWGDPPALSFTATKRLAMRAEASGVPCWLIRRGATENLSAARERWRVKSLPSLRRTDDPHAPGDPQWEAELFRSRTSKPSTWVVRHERAADRIHISSQLRDGHLEPQDGAQEHRPAR